MGSWFLGDWYETEAVWELPCRAWERTSPSSGGEHRVEGEVVTAEVLKVGARVWLSLLVHREQMMLHKAKGKRERLQALLHP